MRAIERVASYRLVLLPGHVRSQHALDDERRGLHAPVPLALPVHALKLLDGDGSLGPAQELGKAIGEGEEEGTATSAGETADSKALL